MAAARRASNCLAASLSAEGTPSRTHNGNLEGWGALPCVHVQAWKAMGLNNRSTSTPGPFLPDDGVKSNMELYAVRWGGQRARSHALPGKQATKPIHAEPTPVRSESGDACLGCPLALVPPFAWPCAPQSDASIFYVNNRSSFGAFASQVRALGVVQGNNKVSVCLASLSGACAQLPRTPCIS